MSPFQKTKRIDRALDMLDRIIAMIEAESAPSEDESVWQDFKNRSPSWRDREVRSAMIGLYGRMSSRRAVNLLAAEFGDRAPSKSTVARLFVEMAKHRAMRLN